jgi:hypothetical protein
MTRPVVVVAELSPGHYLAQFEECERPNTICMDPPPFRFNANVITTLYGEPPPSRLQPATTSHYGMPDRAPKPQAQLLLLHGDGRDYVMPRYASADLARNRAGDFHLLLWRPAPPWWLPCSVAELREEVRAEDFSRDLRIPPEQFHPDDDQEKQAYVMQADGSAFPRHAIAVSRLGEHLRELRPGVKDMRCEPESNAQSS